MRLQNKISLLVLLPVLAFAQNGEMFRSPAKLYAGAYSIKLQLKKGLIEYDVPVWIKPDQAESTLDPMLLKELGYIDPVIEFHEVKISGVKIEKKKFKSANSEWAFVPDFAHACCFGVLGRDVLEKYEIKFNPAPAPSLQWKHLVEKSNPPPYTQKYLSELKSLFSLSKTFEVPFTLNLQERDLKYVGLPKKERPDVFTFFFVPPERFMKVMSIHSKDAASAKRAGLYSGALITKINDQKVSEMDRWVIEKYLRGERATTIKLLTKQKKEFTYDFSKQQFL